jgi:hypothetical protein
MSLKFITIETNVLTEYPRNVSLEYNTETKTVYLLGMLSHNTQIVIDQKLVDQLQEIINDINKQ